MNALPTNYRLQFRNKQTGTCSSKAPNGDGGRTRDFLLELLAKVSLPDRPMTANHKQTFLLQHFVLFTQVANMLVLKLDILNSPPKYTRLLLLRVLSEQHRSQLDDLIVDAATIAFLHNVVLGTFRLRWHL